MKRGYVRPLKRLTEEGQIRALIEAGVPERSIQVEGRDGESLAVTVKAARKGDVLTVRRLRVLAEPKKSTKDVPRNTLRDTLIELRTKGVVIHETDTGVQITCAPEEIEAIAGAFNDLASGGDTGSKKQGRPPKIPWAMPEDKDNAKLMWESAKYVTADDAVAAINDKFFAKSKTKLTRANAYYLFGKRGPE